MSPGESRGLFLGPSDGVLWHSFRDAFLTACFTEMEPTQAHTHQRNRLAGRITPRCKMPPYSPRFQGTL